MNLKKKLRWIVPLSVLLVALIAAGLWWFIVVDNIADEVIIEAGSMPLASDYLIRDLNIPAEFETDLTTLDLTKPGLYEITVSYNGRSYPTALRVRDTIAPTAGTQNLTVFATQKPEAADFLTSVQDVTDVTVTYQAEPDMTLDGVQDLTLILTDEGGNTTELQVQLNVIQDDTAPRIEGVAQLRHYLGHEVDYLKGITVTDDLDPDVQIVVDDSAVDLTTPGKYDIAYSATDACGNRTTVCTSITVIDDHQAPQILGAFDRSLYLGSTIAYRSGIVIRDDIDEAPVLTVDSSQVDLSTPGTYPLIYRATDEAGNESIVEVTVTVKKKASYFVDEETIYAEVDRMIEWVIRDDMTTREQVEAIYYWIQHSFRYVSDSDKTDWKQNAYSMMVNREGDCYSFFALSKLMFERLGIPNIDVKRVRTSEHWADHYWNMVSLDGGETWYHYDSTPFVTVPEEFCLVTDAYLDAFSAKYRNYYNRDRDSLPATPEE